jgi:hypothetical protein
MRSLINQPATRADEQNPPYDMHDIGFGRSIKEISAVVVCYAVRLVVSTVSEPSIGPLVKGQAAKLTDH